MTDTGQQDDALQQAMSRVRALPCWQQPHDLQPLVGGITNVNITLRDQGRRYVVRLGSDIPEHGILRFNELAISQAASAAGVSPAVHYAEAGAMVLDYVDAEPLNEASLHDTDTLLAVVDLVARVHRDVTRELRGPILTFWVFHALRDYAGTLQDLDSRHVALLPPLLAEADRLAEAIGPITLVLGHNDLLPANVLRDAERFWLVDWEYGGFNSPLFDLGGLASNAGLDSDAERQMLTAYFGSPPDDELLHRYGAMKCASLLRETLWSMVSEQTSAIDFDYAAYTDKNLARYRRAFTEFTA